MRSYNFSVITLHVRTINYCPSTISEPIPMSYLHPDNLSNETPNGDRNERRRQSHAEALFAHLYFFAQCVSYNYDGRDIHSSSCLGTTYGSTASETCPYRPPKTSFGGISTPKHTANLAHTLVLNHNVSLSIISSGTTKPSSTGDTCF
jgi:hypothetical protein